MRCLLLFIFVIIIESQKPKFCFNCKYFIPSLSDDIKFGSCQKFPIVHENTDFLVSGVNIESETIYYYCSTARLFNDYCGVIGKYHIRKYTRVNNLNKDNLNKDNLNKDKL